MILKLMMTLLIVIVATQYWGLSLPGTVLRRFVGKCDNRPVRKKLSSPLD